MCHERVVRASSSCRLVGLSLLLQVMQGYNGTILAYGQTSCGALTACPSIDMLISLSSQHPSFSLLQRLLPSLLQWVSQSAAVGSTHCEECSNMLSEECASACASVRVSIAHR